MTAVNNQSRTGRRYDREFKNNAVALVRSGRTVTEVARDLGVSKWSLGRWVEQAKTGQTLSGKTLAPAVYVAVAAVQFGANLSPGQAIGQQRVHERAAARDQDRGVGCLPQPLDHFAQISHRLFGRDEIWERHDSQIGRAHV